MVVEEAARIIGCVYVILVRPLAWPDAHDASQLPQISSFVVRADCRNQGAGTCLLGAVEEEVKSRGLKHLYLGVDHTDSGAIRLYDRLGYVTLSQQPYRSTWTTKDADGEVHEVVEWLIDMMKKL